MNEHITGGCRCGAIRYKIALDHVPPIYACHCTDCQTWTGTAFSEQLLVAEECFELTGSTGEFQLVGASGNISFQRACKTCFSRVFNTNSGRPGIVIIRAGTLDRSSELVCAAHIWTGSKQPWFRLARGVAAWPEGAPIGAIERILNSGALDPIANSSQSD